MERQVKSEPEPNLDPDAKCYKCGALLGMGVTRCWVCMVREPRAEPIDLTGWICLGVAIMFAIGVVVIVLSQ